MPSFLILVFTIILVVVIQVSTGRSEDKKEGFCEPPPDKPVIEETSTPALPALTRAEIESKLKELDRLVEEAAKLPPPPMAMCYAPKMVQNEPADYVCRVCGSKTSHTQERIQSLESARLAVKELKPMKAALDERAFCAVCNKEAKNPGVMLELTLPGSNKPVLTPVTASDIYSLRNFLSIPKLTNDGAFGMRIGDSSKKIHEMLGYPVK